MLDPLKRAIEFCGSQAALGAAIKASQQQVSYWLQAGRVPAEYVIPIESATSGAVTRHDLRPDLYPVEVQP